jgi:pyruvate formate lyase activating enzyme
MNWNTTTKITRRGFLRQSGAAAAAPLLATPALKEARFYKPVGRDKAVRCTLCPRGCVVPNGKRGYCRVRENRGGRYFTLVYGRPCAINNDPIEKKPFFHVYPGSKSLSIATVGCNMACKFCQNWDISQSGPDRIQPAFQSPDDIVRAARDNKSKTIAFTYSEPTIFYEYMFDTARAAKDAGIGSVVVSNGFISKDPLQTLLPLLTAYKIDLKAFSQNFYGNVCDGRLKEVQDTLKRVADSDVWLEIVVLVIPTLNDNPDEIRRMAAWIVKELGPDVPVHFTRFHPQYKLRNLPRTPIETMRRCRVIAQREGCRFVYGGNMPGAGGESTSCPKCGTHVIDRYGHGVMKNEIRGGKCPKCGTTIPGVWG